jgi:ankyrin repeat protein
MNIVTALLSSILVITTIHVLGMESNHTLKTNQKNTSVLINIQENSSEKDLLYYGALGDTDMVNKLLDQGTNPNIYDNNKMTLMHYAACYGYIGIVDRLLAHPDYDKNDITEKMSCHSSLKTEESPFMLALKHNQIEVIEHILNAHTINCDELLCSAAYVGSLNLVRTLLACNVNANALDKNKCSSLYCAAKSGHANIIELLIAHGADLNYKCEEYTALHRACHSGHINAARILIKHSNKDQINTKVLKYEYTALHLATLFQHRDIVEELLTHPDIEVNALSNEKYTLLDIAIYYTTNDYIKNILIQYGGAESDKNRCTIL